MSRRVPWFEVLPAIVVAVVAVVFARSLVTGDGTPEPVAVEATGARFETVAELAAASDRVVVGTVVAVAPGRAIADPIDPDAGIVTQLATLRIDRSIIGPAGTAEMVIEQEATLLDGTPIVVNGVEPLVAGDVGVAFLVIGTTDDFPYSALVNDQAWLTIAGTRLMTDRTDPIHERWNGQLLDDLAAALG